MKGALRVALLLFTALPVQRWLLACGAVMVAAGYLLPPPALVLGLLGLVLAFVPILFASGVLLRYIAAPRMMQLIPGVRAQILGGMVLVPLIFATAFTILTVSLAPRFDQELVWLRVAAGVSAVMISQFVMIAGARGRASWFLFLAIAFALSGTAGARDFLLSIGQSPALLVAFVAVSWCGFAIWFLRGRPLRAPSLVGTLRWGRQSAPASYHNAVRAFLFGNPSLPAQFVGGLLIVVTVLLTWSLLGRSAGGAHSFGESFAKAAWLAIGVGAYAGIGGWMVARRSKFLWLRCGLDRRGLFRLCEREAWNSFIATASGTFLLVPMVWLTGVANGLEYTAPLVFQLSAGACLLYLGLMRVRGWKVFDVVSSLALFFAWGVACGNGQFLAEHVPMALALSAAMLAAALVLRFVAIYRWRRIDWLVSRPPSPLAREMNPR